MTIDEARKAWNKAKTRAQSARLEAEHAENLACEAYADYCEFDNPRVAAMVRHALKEQQK